MDKNYNGFQLNEDGLSIRDSHGTSHTLRRKSLLVFKTLVEADGASCTKQQILDAVWSDVEVTDDSLVQCIAEIRRLLDDKDKRVLQTIPRYGYRLVPDLADRNTSSRKQKGLNINALASVCVLVLVFVIWVNRPADQVHEAENTQSRPAILITQFENVTDEQRWERLARHYVVTCHSQATWVMVESEHPH